MILFFVWQSLTSLDSLQNLLAADFKFKYIIESNSAYLKAGLFDSACSFLKKYESWLGFEEQAQINFLMGDNLFFKTDLFAAREQYLKTVAKYSNAKYANDALERLHLFESARKDTVMLKRLARGIYLYEIKELKLAEDSLKNLIKTDIGDYALYYLALVYNQKDEYNQALSAIEQLQKDFPASRIHQARLLVAEIYLKIGKEKEAVKILEEMVVKHPNTPSGIRSKEILKKLSNLR
ncbi:MAG: tetratricopeptide repeat protein [candidate division WOR-3 bacterium]|nr:tetratricopeptide repeat protein [candidate division WOR-3 bacterium]